MAAAIIIINEPQIRPPSIPLFYCLTLFLEMVFVSVFDGCFFFDSISLMGIILKFAKKSWKFTGQSRQKSSNIIYKKSNDDNNTVASQ